MIGPSGSGKSSVIYAGLLPRLRPEGRSLIVSFRPGDRPLRALAVALIPLLEAGMSETDQLLEITKLGDALERGDLQLSDVADGLRRKHPGADRLVVIADQFEELYTLCQDRDVRQRFLDQLLTAAARGISDAGRACHSCSPCAPTSSATRCRTDPSRMRSRTPT